MSMTMQKVDDRRQLSLPLFYPDYKPGCQRFRSSTEDVQLSEGYSGSPRSPPTQRSSHRSTKQHAESNPGRPTENSLKSCLMKSNNKPGTKKDICEDSDNEMKRGYSKEISSDRKAGSFKDADNELNSLAKENRSKFPRTIWRARKVDHQDSEADHKKNSENLKTKGFSYPRFRYPLRFHYGLGSQSKSRTSSAAIPSGFRTVSFYASLPRRQRQVAPENLFNEKKARGKGNKRGKETKQSPEVEKNGRNSRDSSPERELNGVFHMVHETEIAQALDTTTNKNQEFTTTHKDNIRQTKNQTNDDDDDDDVDEVLEVKDVDSSRRSSVVSKHSIPTEESIKESGSSSVEEQSLKKESSGSDDVRRSRKKEKRKNMKKKKNGDKVKTETSYAADFDADSSDIVSVD